MRDKVFDIDLLAGILASHKAKGLKIAYCHGCFDLMHPGHIRYLQAASRMADVLAVTCSPDEFVDKGPGRPVFDQDLRVTSLAALECVDYAAVNRWPTAVESIRLLKPDYYVKGQEFESLEDKTGKLQLEVEAVREVGAEMRFTHEVVFSSTQLLNTYFRIAD